MALLLIRWKRHRFLTNPSLIHLFSTSSQNDIVSPSSSYQEQENSIHTKKQNPSSNNSKFASKSLSIDDIRKSLALFRSQSTGILSTQQSKENQNQKDLFSFKDPYRQNVTDDNADSGKTFVSEMRGFGVAESVKGMSEDCNASSDDVDNVDSGQIFFSGMRGFDELKEKLKMTRVPNASSDFNNVDSLHISGSRMTGFGEFSERFKMARYGSASSNDAGHVDSGKTFGWRTAGSNAIKESMKQMTHDGNAISDDLNNVDSRSAFVSGIQERLKRMDCDRHYAGNGSSDYLDKAESRKTFALSMTIKERLKQLTRDRNLGSDSDRKGDVELNMFLKDRDRLSFGRESAKSSWMSRNDAFPLTESFKELGNKLKDLRTEVKETAAKGWFSISCCCW